MKAVVITGGTRGLGLALADCLLQLGARVAVCGRSDDGTVAAVRGLAERHGKERVVGFACDVREPRQVQRLWDRSMAAFQRLDIWVNNAGLSNQQRPAWQVPTEELEAVVDTNLLGVIHGSQIACRGMLAQGYGAIYNMEGMGADGRMHEGLVPYGLTKYAVDYFTKGLARELQATPLIIGSIRPGMLATEMVTSQYRGRPEAWKRARRIFNIIANSPEEVAPKLARRILENQRTGTCITTMRPGALLWRFVVSPFRRRDLFPADLD